MIPVPNGKSKGRVIPIEKDTPLTVEQIISAVKHCQLVAESRWALIGGALFVLLGHDIETPDVDIAADRMLEWNGDYFTTLGKNSTPGAGHLLIDGVPVEWMTEGTRGSDALFEAAIDNAYLHPKYAIWCAPLEFALAIKLYAGRDKDKELFREMWDNDEVDGNLVINIVKTLTGFMPEI